MPPKTTNGYSSRHIRHTAELSNLWRRKTRNDFESIPRHDGGPGGHHRADFGLFRSARDVPNAESGDLGVPEAFQSLPECPVFHERLQAQVPPSLRRCFKQYLTDASANGDHSPPPLQKRIFLSNRCGFSSSWDDEGGCLRARYRQTGGTRPVVGSVDTTLSARKEDPSHTSRFRPLPRSFPAIHRQRCFLSSGCWVAHRPYLGSTGSRTMRRGCHVIMSTGSGSPLRAFGRGEWVPAESPTRSRLSKGMWERRHGNGSSSIHLAAASASLTDYRTLSLRAHPHTLSSLLPATVTTPTQSTSPLHKAAAKRTIVDRGHRRRPM
ncbi:hypothetical protein C8F01DRAFT_1251301 [Mycena amicta]|nr:hypothetical protein C8F01DRAFT_1251301 [Mycena amicta]